jgi:thiamine biosynthesis protein ThiS
MTVDALLQELGVKGRVAVMVNDDIVKRERYAERKIANQDRIEVIAVVGGG